MSSWDINKKSYISKDTILNVKKLSLGWRNF